jgi:hypothetical protein
MPNVRLRRRTDLFAFFFACFMAGCGKQTPPPQRDLVGSPIGIHVEKYVRIPPVFADETPILKEDIPVRNDTSRTVVFAEPRPACSCAGVQLGTRTLEPGQETTLRIEARLFGRSGEQRFACSLVDDRGQLWIYGFETAVLTAMRFTENGALHFGNVDPNATVTRQTELRLCGRDETRLPSEPVLQYNAKRINISLGQARNETLPSGIHVRTIPIEIQLTATAAPGIDQAEIRYARPDDPSQFVRLELTWKVRSLFQVSPGSIFFGQIKPGMTESMTKQVTLCRDDSQPFAIKYIRINHAAIKANVHCEADNPPTLEFTLNPTKVNQTIWEEAEVVTDHPIQPVVRIPVAVFYKPKS